ncbi:DUF7522 family protein [Halospeciosus flavus]|uniref:Uncharacterized protein n=1 Tax=Halospeciosus flavus TaxID=3032283 RepID=A0ABD5Z4Z2_9EURY|nr:hypothetical protein [Halospeciosus flavus]
MRETAETVREEVEGAVGDALRVVSYFVPDGGEVVYMRADIREEYSEDTDERVLEHARLESTAKPAYDHLFDGEMQATTRVFPETLVTVVPTGQGEGILFSLDKYASYDYVTVVDTVERLLDGDE